MRRFPLEQLTPRTVSDPAVLLRLAEEDRARGCSESVGERLRGGSAVAAPFSSVDERHVGALVLAIPSERLEEHRIPLPGAAVAAAAAELSVRLGHAR